MHYEPTIAVHTAGRIKTIRRIVTIPVLLALATVPTILSAQTWQSYSTAPEVTATPGCNGGISYDDGSFEFAYSIGAGNPGDAIMVQKMNFGANELDQVCICFVRDQGNPGSDSFPFDVVFYDNDGPNNEPGTMLGAVTATATSVPTFPQIGMYEVDLSGAGINYPGGDIYVGARWPGGESHLLCGDTSSTTPQRDLLASGDHGATWPTMAQIFPFNAPRALGIRADLASTGGGCVANDTTLCLQNNRFAVNVTWQTNDGAQGNGQAIELTQDSGFFWFFNPDNVEMVIKVLDGCALNDRFWVFAGGLTNVRVDMFVTDTETQTTRHYVNPQVTPFQPIQDTNAFATCP